MDKLEKAYEAVSMLESLNLPVSDDVLNSISQMEKDYLLEEIIPLIKQELEPLVKKMRNQFNINVAFTKDKVLDIQLAENLPSSVDEDGYRKKKYIIRVKFPDERVLCHRIVSHTFAEVIKYAGTNNVKKLGIKIFGENIISNSLLENKKYQAYQNEIEPGVYVCTYCNTDRKFEILNTINRELNLNLLIEKVLIDEL